MEQLTAFDGINEHQKSINEVAIFGVNFYVKSFVSKGEPMTQGCQCTVCTCDASLIGSVNVVESGDVASFGCGGE